MTVINDYQPYDYDIKTKPELDKSKNSSQFELMKYDLSLKKEFSVKKYWEQISPTADLKDDKAKKEMFASSIAFTTNNNLSK